MKLPTLSTASILATSLAARIGFLVYGLYQDKYMEVPYTDIDYYVFTDAARFVYQGLSPYLRATYRYTPLLSWLLVPTAFEQGHQFWFESGKLLFVLCDLITGYLVLRLLTVLHKDTRWSLLWFYNPMVITISTRGSSESLLTVVVMAGVYLAVTRRYVLSGVLLGLGIHLKIYPFLYIPAILLFIDHTQPLWKPITRARLAFVAATIASFAASTALMYYVYGQKYLDEAFLYHLTRLDHRHNFSVYNLSLYFTSYSGRSALPWLGSLTLEKLAFVPQLGLSALLIPLRLCYQNGDPGVLVSSLFVQTFTFIAFNKVITSQYFVWFLCLLPVYLSQSSVPLVPKGVVLLSGWVVTQAAWLYSGYRLEFRGDLGVFRGGLWPSAVAFFVWNCYMIGSFVQDIGGRRKEKTA